MKVIIQVFNHKLCNIILNFFRIFVFYRHFCIWSLFFHLWLWYLSLDIPLGKIFEAFFFTYEDYVTNTNVILDLFLFFFALFLFNLYIIEYDMLLFFVVEGKTDVFKHLWIVLLFILQGLFFFFGYFAFVWR